MAKKPSQKELRAQLIADAKKRQAAAPDPMSQFNIKSLALRLGIPLAIGWIVAIFIDGWIPKAIAGALTLVLAGVVIWALRFAKKTRAVADIVRTADTEEGRKAALEKLDADFKKDDTAAVFAKAQLQMQDEPRAALKTLEQINLEKVMAPVADEARAQRAMIHLMLGETDKARPLVDKIDLSRHKEAKTRATMVAIVGEAWARSGQAKRAVELLEKIDVDDAEYADLRPQLLRSKAFAYAWANQTKQMKATLRRLKGINLQLLFGFITKKKNPMGVNARGVHPALEKEAFAMVMKSGQIPRKMEMRRH